MYILPIIIPLYLLILNGIMGRKLGIKGLYNNIWLIMLIGLISSLILYKEIVINNQILNLHLFNWINLDILQISWNLLFDDLSVSMLIVVYSISLIVILYTYDYMISDPHIIRFYNYIILFVLSMIILITTSYLPILFIGWEGVGLSSYLLISYWFTRIETSLGGIIAILVNRIGDIFFILGILLSIFLFNSSDLIIINTYLFNYDLLLLFFFLAAMAKSAQLFLHIWLPYSMEGPTPISALLHAATMVTAGVYLLLRLSLLLNNSHYILIFITIIGGLTTFIGSTLALTSLDMKELIAYSTMSQLGYMIVIIGLKYFNLSFYHLVFHAYFKALLFLIAGSIIHSVFDVQDFRFYGSLYNFLPLSYIFSLIGFTSLSGLPFTTGFYSKETIINSSYLSLNYLSEFVYLITIITAFLTIFYSYKFLLKIFFSTTNISLFLLSSLHYYSLNLTLSLFIISIFTLFVGFLLSKYIYILNLPISYAVLFIPFYIKIIPLLLFISLLFFFLPNYFNLSFSFLNYQFYFKILYLYISGLFLSLAYRIFFKLFDYGFLDLLSPFTGYQLYAVSNRLSIFLTTPYYISLLFFSLYIFLFLI